MNKYKTSCKKLADLKNDFKTNSFDEDLENVFINYNNINDEIFEKKMIDINNENIEDERQFENDRGFEIEFQQFNNLKRSRKENEYFIKRKQKKFKQTYQSVIIKNIFSMRSFKIQIRLIYNAHKVLY